MSQLTAEKIDAYRTNACQLHPGQRLKNIDEAIEYVKKRGFIYFWPIKGIPLPSLWAAVAGDRPVANAHDDPGHITWGWKDDSLGKRVWYYGKILRKKSTMIDLSLAPYFYALSENYGNPEEDVMIQYHEGRLTLEAKSIFEVILENGPLDTIAIRKKTHLTAKESNSRFDRAISLLQSDFKILPVGISDSGGWRYAFIYDLTHRYYPEILEAARHIKERDAHIKLASLYFQSVGAAQLRDVTKLFGWRKPDAERATRHLVAKDLIVQNLAMTQQDGEWFALKTLVEG